MKVEVLFFDGCPSHERLLPRLTQLIDERGVDVDLVLRRVESLERAEAERFLGSPTVRVNGRDVEPGAEQRDDFGLKCRLYPTENGASGVPPEEWITLALNERRPAAVETRAPAPALDELVAAIARARPRFGERERRLALALYKLLAEGRPVSAAALSAATDFAADAIEGLLERWPELLRDDQGRVVAFGGLSLAETAHQLRVDHENLYAWCAWDTLFLPALIGKVAEVRSECPVTGDTVELTVTAEEVARVDPPEAVLSMRSPTDCCAGDDLIARFCQHVNYFASEEAAARWLEDRQDGFVLSVERAFELGQLANRANFGDALD